MPYAISNNLRNRAYRRMVYIGSTSINNIHYTKLHELARMERDAVFWIRPILI